MADRFVNLFEPDTLLRELVEYLAAKKYSQPAFNQKR